MTRQKKAPARLKRSERRAIIQEETEEQRRAVLRGQTDKAAGIRAVIEEHTAVLLDEETEELIDETLAFMPGECALDNLLNLLHPDLFRFLTLYDSDDFTDQETDLAAEQTRTRAKDFIKALRPKLRRAIDEQVGEILAGQVAS